MAVIDLGELRADDPPDPPARPPRAAGRPFRSVVVLLAALVTLAGAAPAPRRVAATVPGGPGAAVFVVADRVYVVEPPDPERGVGRQLVAYRATAGRPQTVWRVPLPGDGDAAMASGVDSWLLLACRAVTNNAGWETLALDAATGRLGWRRPGVAFRAGDAVLLHTSEGEGADETRRLEVGTGRTLWSLPTPSNELSLSYGPSGIERLVLMHDSDTAEVFDATSGVRLVARDLGSGAPPGRRFVMTAVGLLLVIQDVSGTVTGYDLDTLDRRWSVSLPRVSYVDRCGRSLCAYRQDGGVGVLDPATGATRWTDRRWLAAPAAADGRLLVEQPTATTSTLAVVEEATGRLVADLGKWQVVPGADRDDPVIGVRLGGDGRLIIAELDPVAGHARIRDALRGAVGDCSFGGALLVCRRIDGRFALWWNR
ncbi:PQQ-binding-like beta-propeller repeat protein [Micromonospora sp. SL4-19]|uniref:outer membrane protein assembly factor BamB family protein n=1 Tax=Micromonospora sp. SL4-19 TaxID=3399129 RepID=UPI003A4E43BA